MTTVASRTVGATDVRVVVGDLTAQVVDAIVNAANEYLKHGGGVAAAIVRAGGHSIQDESDRWVADNGPLGAGSAAVTSAGKLAARRVIHTVGPRYAQGQDNEALLGQAVVAALDAAVDAGVRTVAIPAISAGIFGYPPDEATAVIAAATVNWLQRRPADLAEVLLVGYDDATGTAFAAGLAATD
jgi:putative ATPase